MSQNVFLGINDVSEFAKYLRVFTFIVHYECGNSLIRLCAQHRRYYWIFFRGENNENTYAFNLYAADNRKVVSSIKLSLQEKTGDVYTYRYSVFCHGQQKLPILILHDQHCQVPASPCTRPFEASYPDM